MIWRHLLYHASVYALWPLLTMSCFLLLRAGERAFQLLVMLLLLVFLLKSSLSSDIPLLFL
jgi:hypothetical protein